MMMDVDAEKAKLTGIVESLEQSLAERDSEIHNLKGDVSVYADVCLRCMVYESI